MKFLIVLSNDCVGALELIETLLKRNHEIGVLLIEDAVFLADKGKADECSLGELDISRYISQKHLAERGLADRLALSAEIVDYPTMVDLLMEQYDRIISL